jgi:hypothetical protein
MFVILAAAASAVQPAATSTPVATVQCRVTVGTGPRYQVRCPAMPVSPAAERDRGGGASGAALDASRGR